MGFGEYPREYNVRIHGPYDPSRWYGKADPLATTKLGDLGAWIGRRNLNPQAMAACASRAYWRWAKAWMMPKRAGFAPIGQCLFILSSSYYFFQYYGHQAHRHTKYH